MSQSKQGRIKDDSKADHKPFIYPKILTIEKLRNEYKKDGFEYSDEQLTDIRNALNFLHELCYQAWVKSRKQKQELTITKNEESHIIYPSEYRRAS